MNNIRGNNRRRGRGNNNRQQGGGGGQQLNRIDSRARGNAPQLLEKYRKLAHDAHLNGDRVTEETYLQYADHYFRVIADARVRQEDQRVRRDDRWQEGGDGQRDDADDGIDYGMDAEENGYVPLQQPQSQVQPQRDRYERPERNDRNERREPREPREQREPRDRDDRPRREERSDRPVAEPVAEPAVDVAVEAQGGEEQPSLYEPAENPFTRPVRSTRGLRPRREDRRPRNTEPADNDADGNDGPSGFDVSVLPPSIASAVTAEPEAQVETGAVAEEKPKRRGRPRKVVPTDDAGEAMAATGSE